MRLKNILKKDMGSHPQRTAGAGAGGAVSPKAVSSPKAATAGSAGGGVVGSPSAASTPKSSSIRSMNNSNVGSSIISTAGGGGGGGGGGVAVSAVGDYILTDLLLEELDFDVFLTVEAHYIRALQLKVFRAWSAAVEDTDSRIVL